jgi:hypothetical protein
MATALETATEAMNDSNTASVAVAVFAIVFLFYSSTVFPNISSGDSGELAAAACSGSTMHPPGYPLFAIMSQVLHLI